MPGRNWGKDCVSPASAHPWGFLFFLPGKSLNLEMRFSAAAGIETEAGRGEKLQSSPVRCGRYRDSVPCQLLTSQPPRGEPEQPNNLKQSPCPHLVSPLNGGGMADLLLCHCCSAKFTAGKHITCFTCFHHLSHWNEDVTRAGSPTCTDPRTVPGKQLATVPLLVFPFFSL